MYEVKRCFKHRLYTLLTKRTTKEGVIVTYVAGVSRPKLRNECRLFTRVFSDATPYCLVEFYRLSEESYASRLTCLEDGGSKCFQTSVYLHQLIDCHVAKDAVLYICLRTESAVQQYCFVVQIDRLDRSRNIKESLRRKAVCQSSSKEAQGHLDTWGGQKGINLFVTAGWKKLAIGLGNDRKEN